MYHGNIFKDFDNILIHLCFLVMDLTYESMNFFFFKACAAASGYFPIFLAVFFDFLLQANGKDGTIVLCGFVYFT